MKDTKVNSNFADRVVVDTACMPWVASPEPGVERKLLDRIGGEVARATTIVRYAPGSAFPIHTHGMGEEFFVLEGVFSDASGDYSEGTYVRNPPGSAHAPYTKDGCLLFVKLRQMPAMEHIRLVVDTCRGAWLPGASYGHNVQTLHVPSDSRECVLVERLDPGAQLPRSYLPAGEEILVLSGVVEDDEGRYPVRTWIRNPAGHQRSLRSESGAVYWVKRGHLPPNV